MKHIEIDVAASTVQERLEMAACLLKNGYRVAMITKTGADKKKRTILIADRPED